MSVTSQEPGDGRVDPPAAPGSSPLRASAQRLLRRVGNPRHWSLAVRVVCVTILLSTVAVFAVGAYLTSVIADGLYEQRREHVLDDSTAIRADLTSALRGTVGSTSAQTQDTAAAFIQDLRNADESAGGRDAALVPLETSASVSTISSDRSMLDLVDEDFTDAIAEDPYAMTWRSVGRPDADGNTQPHLLVGTRVIVPGSGSYDLYLLYSLGQEQQTLSFVQNALVGGAFVLLTLFVGIAVVVARLVTSPLRRAAGAAERIAGGDLGARVEVTGADELAKVGTSFNDMAQNLEQKVEDLTELSRVQQRFVSDVSHELRTPLTTIRMATVVLDEHREEFPAEVARTTELLSTQVERFETLLADLLEISRFDAGAAELEAHVADLGPLVLRASENVRPLAGSRGSLLDVQLDEGDAEVVMDSRRVERVLRNLLTNAVEHGAGSPVKVRMAGNQQAVAVTVQDFGQGIDAGEAARVFDRFWRADPSRARTLGGTGLGLAISVEDAHLHGGWLQAWGQKGEGAVFRLTLPRRPGGHIRRSPLPLEIPFTPDTVGTGAPMEDTTTGEFAIRPDLLPAWDDEPPWDGPDDDAVQEVNDER